MTPLILAIPSKGRLMDQTRDYLADAGLSVRKTAGDRGYSAVLEGAAGIELKLMSASAIAGALGRGEVHLGVTGEDLLRELSPDLSGLHLVRALGFGRADLVVAAPKFWLDARTLSDLDALGAERFAASGRHLRIATKYHRLASAFLARKGVRRYRLIDSAGATEAAPAAGDADLIIDITTTGATLEANGLSPLTDGLILRSEAQLAASLAADWSPRAQDALKGFLLTLEARARARQTRYVFCSGATPEAVEELIRAFDGQIRRDGVVSVPAAQALGAARSLSQKSEAPADIVSPDFIFEATSNDYDEFLSAINEHTQIFTGSAPLE